ncbi:MAG: hypothetical protein MdMp014T_1464 [Treponematales bacterium]
MKKKFVLIFAALFALLAVGCDTSTGSDDNGGVEPELYSVYTTTRTETIGGTGATVTWDAEDFTATDPAALLTAVGIAATDTDTSDDILGKLLAKGKFTEVSGVTDRETAVSSGELDRTIAGLLFDKLETGSISWLLYDGNVSDGSTVTSTYFLIVRLETTDGSYVVYTYEPTGGGGTGGTLLSNTEDFTETDPAALLTAVGVTAASSDTSNDILVKLIATGNFTLLDGAIDRDTAVSEGGLDPIIVKVLFDRLEATTAADTSIHWVLYDGKRQGVPTYFLIVRDGVDSCTLYTLPVSGANTEEIPVGGTGATVGWNNFSADKTVLPVLGITAAASAAPDDILGQLLTVGRFASLQGYTSVARDKVEKQLGATIAKRLFNTLEAEDAEGTETATRWVVYDGYGEVEKEVEGADATTSTTTETVPVFYLIVKL